jgi:hypothetical protein
MSVYMMSHPRRQQSLLKPHFFVSFKYINTKESYITSFKKWKDQWLEVNSKGFRRQFIRLGIIGFLDFVHRPAFQETLKNTKFLKMDVSVLRWGDGEHLRTETHPVSAAFCSLQYRTMGKVQKPSNPQRWEVTYSISLRFHKSLGLISDSCPFFCSFIFASISSPVNHSLHLLGFPTHFLPFAWVQKISWPP